MSKKAVVGSAIFTRDVLLSGSVVAGDVLELADSIQVYNESGDSGDRVPAIWFGHVKLAKETGVAFTAGDQLYWDAANNRLDKTDTNIPAGKAAQDAASGADEAEVFLNL